MGNRHLAGTTGVALDTSSVAGVAKKSPPNPYTQSEAIRALTRHRRSTDDGSIGLMIAMGPAFSSELVLPPWQGW